MCHISCVIIIDTIIHHIHHILTNYIYIYTTYNAYILHIHLSYHHTIIPYTYRVGAITLISDTVTLPSFVSALSNCTVPVVTPSTTCSSNCKLGAACDYAILAGTYIHTYIHTHIHTLTHTHTNTHTYTH
jgi:hypothetical protein